MVDGLWLLNIVDKSLVEKQNFKSAIPNSGTGCH
jgi:hypothetical protein